MNVLNTIKTQMNSAEHQMMSFVYVVFSWGFYYWNARHFTYNNMLGTS
jgi:hypothetical protein